MDITLIIAVATMGGLAFIFAGGLAFADKKLLKSYLHRLEEAKLRDHRKIGKEICSGLHYRASLIPAMD